MSKRSKSRHRHHQSHETKGKEGTAEKNIESPPPLDPTLGKLPKDSDDARDHTDDLFIWKWVKRAGLVAGILYAVVTFLEWKDLRRNFALDQRPWVGVLDTRIIQFGSEQDYILQIQLNNSGKNPALRAWYWNKSRISPLREIGPSPDNMDDGKKHVLLGSVPPQGPRIATLIWHWEDWKQGYGAVMNREALISNFGEFVYYDADSTEHRTQFCIYMKDAGTSSQRLSFCDRFNEMN